MRKTSHAAVALVLTAILTLSACTAKRTELTDVSQAQTEPTVAQTFVETMEQTLEWQTAAVTADECDLALPQERPLTTQEETSEAESTIAATTAATTATTTAVTSATTTTTAATTTAAAKTAASTTAAAKTVTTTAATTDKAVRTTAATTAASATKTQSAVPTSAQAILNRASLHPQRTNDAELDAAVQKVFDRIFTPGMSTYDKVLACYNYIINNSEYGRPKMVVTQDDLHAYQKEQDAWIVLFAKRILTTGQGVCDDYAALFLVMTRAIGLDCFYTHGCTTNTKGETKDHVWDTITVDGVDYIFDAQVEDKQSTNGIRYTFFCKTYDSSIAKIYSDYDLAADKAAYNAFRK